MRVKKMFQGKVPENKILSTYSDSQTDTYSCDYVNHIVESGSNENGSWTKWSDGTMECRGTSSAVSPTTINYPQPFVEIPNLNATIISPYIMDDTAAKMVLVGAKTNTNFMAKCVYWVVESSKWSAAGESFDWVAKGKWK